MVTRADPDDESPATGPIFSNDPFSFDEADVAPWASAIAGEVGSRETAEAVVLRSGRLHTVEPPAPRTATAANTIASSSAPAQAASASPSLGETRGLDNVLYPMNADGSVDITVADINQGTVLGDCYSCPRWARLRSSTRPASMR